MAAFSKVTETSPTRPSDRGKSTKKSSLKKRSPPPPSSRQQSRFLSPELQATRVSLLYARNQQIYEAFRHQYYNLSKVVDTSRSRNQHHKNNKSNFEWISEAFCLGWNFGETALLELPSNEYFYSNEDPQKVKLRDRSSLAALEVTKLLQRILRLMDDLAVVAPAMLVDASRNLEGNSLWLLEDNREECKRKLSSLRYLAKEQHERLDDYESKRLTVASSWNSSPLSLQPPSRTGNHRGLKSKNGSAKKRDPPGAPTLVVDCDVADALMSCTRLFCPAPLPDSPPSSALSNENNTNSASSTSAVFGKQRKNGSSWRSHQPQRRTSPPPPSTSLVDAEEDDINHVGSDLAVFDSRSKNTSELRVKTNQSDDAVFGNSPTNTGAPIRKVKSTFSTQNKLSPKKSSGRNSKKMPNSSKKSYANLLFGKKSPEQKRQERKYRENADFEEALYQSELEAAKAASMREEDLNELLYQSMSIGNSHSQSQSYDERDASLTPTWAAVPPVPRTADANDFDLQQALYLSGLKANKSNNTDNNNHHNNREPEWNRHNDEEEKRDDSGGEALSPLIRTKRQDAVVKGVSTAVAVAAAVPPVVVKGTALDPIVVKGTPIVNAPPGAVQRCNHTDPYSTLHVLRACSRKDFERLRETKKIEVTRVDTYQGRIEGSTNGCTVIAPLLCIRYFKSETKKSSQDGGCSRLSDETIASIIDTESPSLLPAIRKALGVAKSAFLIPHDAHECLIDSKQMDRDQFVTVCGGNILEEGHLGALIQELSKVLPDGKKLGATFFFHQHVIAILQLRDGDSNDGKAKKKSSKKNAVSFDVIDSLPSRKTLRVTNTCSPPSSPPSGGRNHTPQNCARFFCKDVTSLKTFLKWYACSVFNSENERYIDAYQWDEKLTDYDPRVFQAFLWKQA